MGKVTTNLFDHSFMRNQSLQIGDSKVQGSLEWWLMPVIPVLGGSQTGVISSGKTPANIFRGGG
jgi:hypothetical protein